MGRWIYSSRPKAEHFIKLTIFWLRQKGYITLPKNGYLNAGTFTWTINDSGKKFLVDFVLSTKMYNQYIELRYRQEENEWLSKNYEQRIVLTITRCNYGQYRYWFLCPTANCGRRVGVLYIRTRLFACRYCYNLTYQSRKVNRRGKLYGLTEIVDLREKVAKLEKQIKTRFYAGKPTRKQQKIEKLEKYAQRFSLDLRSSGF